MRVGNSYSGAAEDTAVSVGEIFPTFRKIVLPSLSWIKWSQEETEGRFVGNVRIHSSNNAASLGTEHSPPYSFVPVLWPD